MTPWIRLSRLHRPRPKFEFILGEKAWLSAYLSHGGEKALRVEEARHPEGDGAPLETPGVKLVVPLYQFCEPEAQGAGVPGDLKQREKHTEKHQEWNWLFLSISSVNQNPRVLESQI